MPLSVAETAVRLRFPGGDWSLPQTMELKLRLHIGFCALSLTVTPRAFPFRAVSASG